MTYGKEYKILNNFNEYDSEEKFETNLIDLCKKEKAVLFINGMEQIFKK